MLTSENYTRGFLIDDELMAGVSVISESNGAPTSAYAAFVLNHATGEYLGYETHSNLDAALEKINAIQREWKYEASGGCGEGDCSDGGCGKGPCKQSCQTTGICEITS